MSTGRKELTAFERGEVIGAWKCGICERKISEALNHLKTTIHNIISAYKERRNETLPPRTGRQPIILERDVLLQLMYGRVGVKKPLVTEVNRKKRLEWAKERKDWVNEWQPHKKYNVECLIPTIGKSGHTNLYQKIGQILQEEWSNINANKYQNLVDSMPRRVAAVINNKGYPTKY
ncbi:unnamed protein product [Rhizophagus irregularis]|uniref:Uncharacterized protein n=1 Tax=Rhizophagus irregularis TaxID=588596 RepID=A0A916E4S6_9GLOM|nr:unnamed protein product [Rhizophagus irregularis]